MSCTHRRQIQLLAGAGEGNALKEMAGWLQTWTSGPHYVCLFVAMLLSLSGDILVIGLVTLSPLARLRSVLLVLRNFALADSVAMSLQLMGHARGDALCQMQAAVIWCATWASLLWTVAYAHKVERSFRGKAVSEWLASSSGTRVEGWIHHCCWGIPLLATAIGLPLGIWGGSSRLAVSHPVNWHGWCSFRQLYAAIVGKSVGLLAVAYNVVAFCNVHFTIRRILTFGRAVGRVRPPLSNLGRSVAGGNLASSGANGPRVRPRRGRGLCQRTWLTALWWH